MRALPIVFALAIGACAASSPVMDTGDGTYMISARASPARGGTTGAHTVAYQDAQAFCARQDGARPVLFDTQERDVYQSSFGGGISGTPGQYSGAIAGSSAASGAVNMHFRCVK